SAWGTGSLRGWEQIETRSVGSQADAQMSLIAEEMAAADAENKGWSTEVHGLQEDMVGDAQRVLFGLAPALQASNPALARELTESARATAGIRRGRLRSSLVVAEVALSVILLMGAGLMIRSFGRLLTQDFGSTPNRS